MKPGELTAYLHQQIPLTAAMQISVSQCENSAITLAAPLAPNRNHTDTAFGGSISTLGIAAGWSLLHVAILDRGISAKLLIQNSSTDFLRPADGDLKATAAFATPESMEEFFATLKDRRRARIEIESRILSRGVVVATHKGTYVAILY
jgi:thioesterase domain-containing protein